MLLTGRDHWAKVNKLIAPSLDKNVYQTVTSFILEGNSNLGNFDPTILLQCIETRLVTSDQLEYKRMQFELAKQTLSKNLWKYENILLSYHRSAQIINESRFVEIFKKGVYNNDLRTLLILQNLPLTMITNLKATV